MIYYNYLSSTNNILKDLLNYRNNNAILIKSKKTIIKIIFK